MAQSPLVTRPPFTKLTVRKNTARLTRSSRTASARRATRFPAKPPPRTVPHETHPRGRGTAQEPDPVSLHHLRPRRTHGPGSLGALPRTPPAGHLPRPIPAYPHEVPQSGRGHLAQPAGLGSGRVRPAPASGAGVGATEHSRQTGGAVPHHYRHRLG